MGGWSGGKIVKSGNRNADSDPTDVPKGFDITANSFTKESITELLDNERVVLGCYDNELGANAHDVVAAIQLTDIDGRGIGVPHKFSVKIFDREGFKYKGEIFDNFQSETNEKHSDFDRELKSGEFEYVQSSFQVGFNYTPKKDNPDKKTYGCKFKCNFTIVYCGSIMGDQFQDDGNSLCPCVFFVFLNVAPKLVPQNATLVNWQ
jgi:hypothetical protein